jgi:hypothetical protein
VFGDGERYPPRPKSTDVFDTDLYAVATALDLKCVAGVPTRRLTAAP